MTDDKAARTRSPNYPAISLGVAVEYVREIFKQIHTHTAPQSVILGAMGYRSYNGASAPAFSSLQKYGLLDKSGTDYKLSSRALSIEIPRSETEKAAAIREALRAPVLFAKLLDQFGGQLPSDALIRATLMREGFGATAVPQVIQALRDSVELAARYSEAYDPHAAQKQEDAGMFEERQVDPMPISEPIHQPQSQAQRIETHRGIELAEAERELLHGPLSRSASYRLVIKGDAGPKEIGKLIKILELQKTLLEDDEEALG